MSNIFISYKTDERELANRLRTEILKLRFSSVFIDHDPKEGIIAGSKWRKFLEYKVSSARVVILLATDRWFSSKNCAEEYVWAKLAGRTILPLCIPLEREVGHLVRPNHEGTTFGQFVSEKLPSEDSGAITELQWMTVSQAELYSDDGLLADTKERLRQALTEAGVVQDRFPFDILNRNIAPYPGLDPMGPEHAGVFFGREGKLQEAIDHLERMNTERPIDLLGRPVRLLVNQGASGAGKSSFLRAGLLPRLELRADEFFCLPVVRLRNDAIRGRDAIAASLEKGLASRELCDLPPPGHAGTKAGITAELHSSDAFALARILYTIQEIAERSYKALRPESSASDDPISVILPIDQGEELFPWSSANRDTREQANLLCRQLKGLFEAMNSDGAPSIGGSRLNIIVILVMRSDTFPRLQANPCLQHIPRQLIDLPIMEKGSYRTIIEMPARHEHIRLTLERGLPEAILEDFKDAGDALALIAFVMGRLWKAYINDQPGENYDGHLKLEHYRELTGGEGIGGVINMAVGQALLKDRSFQSMLKNAELIADKREREWDQVDQDAAIKFFAGRLKKIFIPNLVEVSDSSNLKLRRVARWSEFANEHGFDEVDRRLIRVLIDEARILTSHQDTSGSQEGEIGDAADDTMIEVSHESVLRQWPLLTGFINDAQDALGLIHRAEKDAERYRLYTQGKIKEPPSFYAQPLLELIYDAFDKQGMPASRIDAVREFIVPEYQRLLQELDTYRADEIELSTFHGRRAEIGEQLNALKDPRPGVGVIDVASVRHQKQRIDRDRAFCFKIDAARRQQLAFLQHALDTKPQEWSGLPDIAWCPVRPAQGATVDIATAFEPNGAPREFTKAISVKGPYFVARFLLTIEQFFSFTGAGSTRAKQYFNDSLFSGFPAPYNIPKANEVAEADPIANYPAQFVNWYQAVAFCRWMTERYRAILGSDEVEVRLPTEWEWLYAADGADGRLYPWGNDWRPELCRSAQGGGRPAAVGLYPKGSPVCGACDMSGLMVEWCLNQFDPLTTINFSSEAPRPTRGGAYFTPFWKKELFAALEPSYAVSIQNRLDDRPNGLNEEPRRIRVGLRLVCTGLDTLPAERLAGLRIEAGG